MGKNRGQEDQIRSFTVLLEHLEAQVALLASGEAFSQVHFVLLGPSIAQTFQHKPAVGAAGGLRYVRKYAIRMKLLSYLL